jgi:hypothetical protein
MNFGMLTAFSGFAICENCTPTIPLIKQLVHFKILGAGQGDQIGRIFAHWVIFYFR